MTTKTYDVLAITNDKGGVGKTTSVVNMALALTDEPWSEKVLVIDLDAQMNACMNLGWNPQWEQESNHTVFRAMSGDDHQLSAYYSEFIGCWYIPSSKRMKDIEPYLRSQDMPLFVLKDLLEKPIRILDPLNGFQQEKEVSLDFFDKILIDCPPSMGIVTMNAWAATKGVIVAFQMESYCMDGLRSIVETYINMKRKANPSIELRGVLRTMYDGRLRMTKKVNAVLEKEMGETLFSTFIPKSTAVPTAQANNGCVMFDAPDSPAAVAYRELLKEMYNANEGEE